MTEILLSQKLNINLKSITPKSITTIEIHSILAFQAKKKKTSFTTFWTSIGPYDIFHMVIFFTLTNLTEHGNCLYSAVT